jgi:ribosome maturation factor RimP
MMGTATVLRELIEPLVIAAGLEVWDVEAGPGLVRILVDGPDGVDLDSLGALTTTVSRALDAAPDVAPAGRYHLEVSSPGVERALRTPEHFARFVGSTLAVKTAADAPGPRRVRGVLAHVDGTGITVVPEGGTVAPEGEPAEQARHIAYSDIQKAHPVLEWGPSPKPGHRRDEDGTGGAWTKRVPAKDTAR